MPASSSIDLSQASTSERHGAATKLLAQLEREVLPGYLAAQRWFAGKGAGEPTVKITEIGRWQQKQQMWLLLVASAQFPAAEAQEYLIPLALQWGAERAGTHAANTLARVRQRAGDDQHA